MYKNLFLFLVTFLISFNFLIAQSPEKINYQGVARDMSNNPIPNQAIGLRISIFSGNPTGTLAYEETHSDTTNALGLFSLQIGGGLVTAGVFDTIHWGVDSHFVKVEMDPAGGTAYQDMGTTQLLSVAYALHANTVSIDNVNDADADTTNEIQTISKVGNLITLSHGGGSVIDSIIDGDADSDSTNELQTISKTGNIVTLSDSGGSFIDEVNDEDADSTNEIQILTVTGSLVSLSLGGGSFIDRVDDLDPSPTNEIQNLSITGQTLTISGGNSISIPYDPDWNGISPMYNIISSTVGIGSSSPHPNSKFAVYPGNQNLGIYCLHYKTDSGAPYGLNINLEDTYTGSATLYGGYITGLKSGGGGSVFGLYSGGLNYNTSGTSPSTYGVYAYGYRSNITPVSTTYALYAQPAGFAATQWAGYFSGEVYTTGSYQGSDRKLKTEIQPYSGALSALLQLETYRYSYDNQTYKFMNLPEGPQIGLLAEEVSLIFPHLTKKVVQPPQIMPEDDALEWIGAGNYTVGDDGMARVGHEVEFTGVNYAGLVPILVESIKEQQQMIELLQAEVAELKSKIGK